MPTVRAVLVLLLLLLLGIAGPGFAIEPAPDTGATGRAAGTVGSPSGADPYFPKDGNGGYDVDHYRIKDTYRPDDDRLRGRTVIHATATQQLTRFHLDLALTPDRVTVNGEPAGFGKPDRHTLRVTPRTRLAEGEWFRVDVRFHGRPASVRAAGVSPFFHSRGEGMALGEPQIGPWWFAANETPTDKATYDIAIRVPRGREAVSNGELVSRTTTGAWTTWRWEMTEPMVTYLAFFLAGELELRRGTADGRPYAYAVSKRISKERRPAWFRYLRRTEDVVPWLESHFGSYPFTSIGGVVTGLPAGFALETQARPVYPTHSGPRAVWLLVHELAHQWFGNTVALTRWRDIWLNEGFATYAEWLYAEEHGGWSVREQLLAIYESRRAASPFWDVRVSDPGRRNLWSEAVYVRGGMTLAALRDRIGDEPFSVLLRTWVERNRDGHGTGEEFRALAEELSGEQLDGFFEEWLDDTDKPARSQANGLG